MDWDTIGASENNRWFAYEYTMAEPPTAVLILALDTTTRAGSPMTEDQIDARYDAAKQRCDEMKGDDKDLCMERAKADKEKAEADAKAGKERAEADRDAAKKSRKADYEVAMKKCEAMSGDAQDKCEADAKARFGK